MSDRCPYTYFSNLIVGETTCDGKKKMYELLSELKPVYVLHLPQGREEYALDMWTSELHRFIAFLEQRFHVTITDEALRAAARQRNAERQARMELLRQLTDEYAVDGIIEVDLQACTPYAIEARRVGRLAQTLEKPFLRLETDYSTGDGGQIATRLEAFFETL